VAGEITTTTFVDVPKLARQVIADIGFTDARMGFDARTCGILNAIQSQSPDIAMGVDTGGAGDQGLMFGYACDETEELMPLPIMMAHKLVRQQSEVRRAGKLTYLRPDAKSQVSVEYVDGKPKRIDAVVLSTQHDDDVTTEQLRADVKKHIIDPIIPSNMVDSGTKFHINPTGRFVVGGPHGDTGLTGRKIIVDTYGGMGRHGGGAFSGKDPTKVDRSACYMARYVAKNIVAAGLAQRCEVQLAYAIGVAEPVLMTMFKFTLVAYCTTTLNTLRHTCQQPFCIFLQNLLPRGFSPAGEGQGMASVWLVTPVHVSISPLLVLDWSWIGPLLVLYWSSTDQGLSGYCGRARTGGAGAETDRNGSVTAGECLGGVRPSSGAAMLESNGDAMKSGASGLFGACCARGRAHSANLASAVTEGLRPYLAIRTGLCPPTPHHNPVGVVESLGRYPRVARELATLGFEPKSLWDLFNPAPDCPAGRTGASP